MFPKLYWSLMSAMRPLMSVNVTDCSAKTLMSLGNSRLRAAAAASLQLRELSLVEQAEQEKAPLEEERTGGGKLEEAAGRKQTKKQTDSLTD